MFKHVIRYRLLVLAFTLLGTALFASQLHNLVLDPDTEAYVPERHPIRVFWEEAKQRFGIGRNILVAVDTGRPGGIFTPEMLAAIRELTEGIKEVDGVIAEEVRSLSDAEAIVGTEDGLDVVPFYEEPPATQAEADAVRASVYDNEVYLGRLVSRDGSIAAIIVQTHHAYRKTPVEVYQELAAYTAAHPIPGARILIAGDPAVEAVFGRQMAADLQRLIPLATVVVVAILFLCFRGISTLRLLARTLAAALAIWLWGSWRGFGIGWTELGLAAVAIAMLSVRGVLLPVLVVVISVVWTWGLQAIAGMPIYIAGTLVPPLLLAIGCADGIHILERYFEKAAASGDREQVVLATMNELWRPVVLTALTTAAGFGSLTASRMTVYRVFGLTTAFGIMVAMLMSLTLLPALLAMLPLPERRARRWSVRFVPAALAALGRWIESHRRAVLVAGVALVVLFRVAADNLRIDYSWVESLEPNSPVLVADRVLRERYSGTTPLSVIVRTARVDGIKDPELLSALDRIATELGEHPQVGDTRSIAEYLKRMNQAMNADRGDAYVVPRSRELIAQYLLLYSMSGNPTEFEDMVDYDYQSANLSLLCRSDRLVVLDDVVGRVEKLLDQYVRPLGATATITGSGMVLKTVMDMIFESQVYSLATATVLVLLSLCVLFRSVRDAFICMIGPFFTGMANFGGMALLGIPLGPEKALISAIALGIGVDYSIHLMSRFRDTVADGMSVNKAIVEAMRTTGRAILFNALVVIAGFLVLAASASPSNAVFGLMIASNMGVSCLAALTLLPAALAVMGYMQQARAERASDEPAEEPLSAPGLAVRPEDKHA